MVVYCSSSDVLEDSYYDAATEIGALMVSHCYDLVFGGSRVGLMGALAKAVHSNDGHITGVIPEFMRNKGIAYEASDELVVTQSLRERKEIMEHRADAFVALPGGFGTLEEVMEVLTLRQLQVHSKPIVLLNINGFYDPLIAFFNVLYDRGFAKKDHRELYFVADSCKSVFDFLASYKPSQKTSKWSG